MRRFCLAAFIAAAVPAAATAAPAAGARAECDAALAARVAAEPADTGARDALARACARAGRPDAALVHWDALVAFDDANADWLLGQAQALTALGRPAEAIPLLERARALAPGYEDVWRANVAALEAARQPERAAALAREAERAFPQSDWPRDRQAAIERARLLERGTRLSLWLAREELSGGRPAWQSATAMVDHPLSGTRRLLAGVHAEERFDTQDEQFSLALVDRVGDRWSWGVAADVAPDGEILPEWNLVAEIGRVLPGNRSVGLRARHASYAAVDVDSLAATFEQYAERFRVAYTLTAARPTGVSARFGHVLRLAHDYRWRSHAGLALGYGEEAETVAPGVVQVTRVKSASVNGVHWMSPAWGFAWEAGWYEQGDLYDRVRIRIGLEHRF